LIKIKLGEGQHHLIPINAAAFLPDNDVRQRDPAWHTANAYPTPD
jgi:hypothetical protein